MYRFTFKAASGVESLHYDMKINHQIQETD